MRTGRVHHRGIAATAGGWRSVATWLGVLALACGRADDGQRSPLPIDVAPGGDVEPAASVPNASSMGEEDTDDAGAAPPSGASFECPAPRPEAAPGVASGWARDPASGECCPYANRNAAPNGWLRFDFEAACRTECICSALEGFEGDYEDLLSVPDSLECRCSVESCPSTVEEAEQSLCSDISLLTAVQRVVGCGLVMVVDRNGYSGHAWVFEQPSESGDAALPAPRLVGGSQFSDVSSFDACPSSEWYAGRSFYEECGDAEVVTCQVCGESPGPVYPPCP